METFKRYPLCPRSPPRGGKRNDIPVRNSRTTFHPVVNSDPKWHLLENADFVWHCFFFFFINQTVFILLFVNGALSKKKKKYYMAFQWWSGDLWRESLKCWKKKTGCMMSMYSTPTPPALRIALRLQFALFFFTTVVLRCQPLFCV